jgi:hypothetical protein
VHRERLVAAEKGLDWPPLPDERQRENRSIDRLLVLAGLTWASVAVGLFVLLRVIAGGPPVQVPWEAIGTTAAVPVGMEWIALAPLGIGLAHLLVFAIGRKRSTGAHR